MTTSDRLLSILGLFTVEQPEWTVEGAAGELGLAVSTAYRYFRSLSTAGLIVAVTTGRYVLGPAIIQYDRQIRLRDPLITAAQPVMKRLAEQIPAHTVILLCRLFRNQVMCIHQEAAERPDFAISYERGRGLPLYRGASSKIILANMPLRTVRAIHDENASRFAQFALGRDWEETKERLRALRTAGHALTQGDLDPGMCGIAVPIFDPELTAIGSLSFVVPARHLTPDFLTEAPQSLKAAADEISWALSLGIQKPIAEGLPASRRPATTERSSPRRSRRAAEPARKTRRSGRRVRA